MDIPLKPFLVSSFAVAVLLGCGSGRRALDAAPDADPEDGDVALRDGSLPDGALPDGALPDGALPDGALPDGALPDGDVADADTGALLDGDVTDADADGAFPDADAALDASITDAGLDADADDICVEGTADCDGVASNGCEVDLETSTANCGGCDRACGADQACEARTCVPWPILLWTQEPTLVGGTGTLEVSTLEVSPLQVVVAGRFRGTLDFGGGAMLANSVSGEIDGYIVSYDTGGVIRWARRLDSGNSILIAAVHLDDSGNSYVAYHTLETGGWLGHIASFDAGGAPRWAEALSATEAVVLGDLTVDEAGRLYVVGLFMGSVDVGGGPTTVTAGRGGFLASYAGATGAYRWSRVVGMSTNGTMNGVQAAGGFVYVAGWYTGDANYGDGVRSTGGDQDIFLVSYADSGGAFRWIEHFDGTDNQNSVQLARRGDALFLQAHVRGSVNFGGTTITDSTAPRATDVVARFATSGAHVWSRIVPGNSLAGVAPGTEDLWLTSLSWLRRWNLDDGVETRAAHRPAIDRGLAAEAREPLLFVVEIEGGVPLIRAYRIR